MKKILFYYIPLLLFVSCTEQIVIDLEKGDPLIGVEASFTDEYKRHEAIISYTSDFYSPESPRMVSGAHVYLVSEYDTIFYAENDNMPGHYLTIDSVAGMQGMNYTLYVDAFNGSDSVHLFASSFMNFNVPSIDSVLIEPFVVSGFQLPNIVCLYPYFQSLDDPTIVYMIKVARNDTLLSDTLTSYSCIPMAGYAGYYVNGPEMLAENMTIPVAYLSTKNLHNGDTITTLIYSIPLDYMAYIYSVSSSMGSNPMMGPPTNVPTNIYPKGQGVGWFYAASVASCKTKYNRTGGIFPWKEN